MDKAQPGVRSENWWPGAALIGLFVFICFVRVVSNGFVIWDDDVNFLANFRYRGLSLLHLRWMFTTFLMGNYQPLCWLTHGFDFVLWGMNPAGYHLGSLIIHTLNAVLFYFLIRAFISRMPGAQGHTNSLGAQVCAGAGVLFFAIHPLRVESVAWATERSLVLCALFFLLTVIAYLKMNDNDGGKRRTWYVLSVVFFACSLLSKGIGMTLPVVLVVLDIYPLRRVVFGEGWVLQLRKLLIEKIPFFVLAAVFGVLAIVAVGHSGSIHALSKHGIGARFMQAGFGLCFYLWKTVMPVRLSPLYLLERSFNPAAMKYVLCAVTVVAITLCMTIWRKKWPWALATWVCHVVIVSPVLGFVQAGEQIAADRYTYLSYLPFGVLIGAGMVRLWSGTQEKRGPSGGWYSAVCGAAVCVVVLSVLTFRQIMIWHDTVSLWGHAVRLDPAHYIGHNSLGNALEGRGDWAAAMLHYNASIQSNPGHATSYNNRGSLRHKRGDFAGALEDYNICIRLNPGHPAAYNNRANLRYMQGDPAGALEDYNTAIRVSPEFSDAYYNRSVFLAGQGDIDGAMTGYNTVIRLNPEHVTAYSNRGNLHHSLGNFTAALADYNTVIRLTPQYAMAYNNRGYLHHTLGDPNRALADYDMAIRLDPEGSCLSYVNRGNLRAQLGDLPGATWDLARALEIGPENWTQRERVERSLADIRATLEKQEKEPSPPSTD